MMILPAFSLEVTKKLLQENFSNWLIKKTAIKGQLALDYLDKGGAIHSINLIFNKKREWEFSDNAKEIYENIEKAEIEDHGKLIKSLAICIRGKLKELKNDLNYAAETGIQFDRSDLKKVTKSKVFYQNYNDDPYAEDSYIEDEEGRTVINYELIKSNDSLKKIFKNCIFDQRILRKGLLGFPVVNQTINIIRSDLINFIEGRGKSDLTHHEGNIFFENFKKLYKLTSENYLSTFSKENIQENNKLVTSYNDYKKPSKEEEIPLMESEEKIDTSKVILSENNYGTVYSYQGERSFQEDRGFATHIELAESCKKDIPRFLTNTFLAVSEKICQEYPGESSEQNIASTLSIALLENNKIYSAWTGDSSIICLKKDKTTSVVTAEYLFWPHNLSIPLAQEAEAPRIYDADGSIEDNRVNGGLAITRALGGKTFGYGSGITDIPGNTVFETDPNVETTVIITSDGLDILSPGDFAEIFNKFVIDNNNLKQRAAFTKACCELAHNRYLTKRNNDESLKNNKIDNMIIVVLTNEANLGWVLDGNSANSGGSTLSNAVNLFLPEMVIDLAKGIENKQEMPTKNHRLLISNPYDKIKDEIIEEIDDDEEITEEKDNNNSSKRQKLSHS